MSSTSFISDEALILRLGQQGDRAAITAAVRLREMLHGKNAFLGSSAYSDYSGARKEALAALKQD